MGFLRHVGSALGLSGGSSVRFDTTGGDESLAATREALAHGKWQATAERIGPMRDWDLRWHWCAELARVPGPSKAVDAWVQARPSDAEPLLLRGMHRIRCAWEARTGADIRLVSEKGYAKFLDLLARAEEDLEEAARRDPEDPTPMAALLHASRGLEQDDAHADELFEEACRRAPLHVAAHQHLLWRRSKKWGGSHEAMTDLAREASARAPRGHRLHVLVAVSELELWLDSVTEGGAATRNGAGEHVLDAEALRHAARASVLAPGYPMTPVTVDDRNWLAGALWKSRALDEAHAVFRTLGGLATELPFGWFADDPRAGFRRAQRECAARANA